MSALWQPFLEYDFMRRALLGCIAIALGSTPIGVFLMLRRMSLTGDAMAHAILPGVAVAYLVSGLSLAAMTLGGIAAGLTIAVLTALASRSTSQREDTSLAAFYLISLALGVVLMSLKGSNVDLMHVLFGSVLALDSGTLWLLCGVSAGSLALLALAYRPLVLECVDPSFLSAVSRWSGAVHVLFLTLVVVNLVVAFQALGTMMAVGIMILPAAAARFWTMRLRPMLIIAVGVATVSSFAGLLVSYYFGGPSGPSIMLAAGACYLFSAMAGREGSLASRHLRHEPVTTRARVR